MHGAVGKGAQESGAKPETARQLIRSTKRYGRRRVSAEDMIRVVMEGLRGEESVADLCRREGIDYDLGKEPSDPVNIEAAKKWFAWWESNKDNPKYRLLSAEAREGRHPGSLLAAERPHEIAPAALRRRSGGSPLAPGCVTAVER